MLVRLNDLLRMVFDFRAPAVGVAVIAADIANAVHEAARINVNLAYNGVDFEKVRRLVGSLMPLANCSVSPARFGVVGLTATS